MLKEWNERSGHRHDLLGRDVHVVDILAGHDLRLVLGAHHDARLDHAILLIEQGVSLGDDVIVLFVGSQVVGDVGDHHLDRRVHALSQQFDSNPARDDVSRTVLDLDLFAGLVVGNLALDLSQGLAHHPAIGRLDEAEVVAAAIGGQRADQADVRAFRSLDGADATVVRIVHVAHLEPGALARQAAGPESRESPLVSQLGQRVGLVHELRQLRRAEELLDGRHHRANVDQRLRGHRLEVLHSHALAHHALETQQTDPELVLQQLAHCAHAAIAQVVNVIHSHNHVETVLAASPQPPQAAIKIDLETAFLDALGGRILEHLTLHEREHVANRRNDIFLGEGLGILERLAGVWIIDHAGFVKGARLGALNLETQLARQLVSTNLGKVVALGGEKQVL